MVLDEKVLTFWRHVLFFSHADDLFKAIFCYKYEIKLYVFDGAKSIPGIDGTFWQKDFGPLRPCWLPYPNQLFYIVNILYCQYFILSIFYIVNICIKIHIFKVARSVSGVGVTLKQKFLAFWGHNLFFHILCYHLISYFTCYQVYTVNSGKYLGMLNW